MKLPYCVDCGFYIGLYESGLELRGGKLVVYEKLKFQEGLCFCQGLVIKDGFRQRKCKYFEQMREGWYSPNQYIRLLKEKLLKKQLRDRVLAFSALIGFVIMLSLIMTLLTNLGLISPPF